MGDRSELLRLLGQVERLAHPHHVRDRYGHLRRDPAGEWDWYYLLDEGLRRWIVRNCMGPVGTGLELDDLSALVGFDSVDDWAREFVQACRVARDRSSANDFDGVTAADDDDELLGPHELADFLGVERSTIRQWRCRDLLPVPDFELSAMPVWTLKTVREWAAETGRTIETAA
jgi:hypothetical protein